MMLNKANERWIVVIGAIICQFFVGMLYSWSIFQSPIANMFGWPISEVSLTFSISTFMLPIAMIVAGMMLPKWGPKKVIMIGGIVLSVGLLVASQTKTLMMLYLGYGFLGGAGVGLVYGVPIATCARWFPDKKGTITGLAVMGFGLGSSVYGPIASRLIIQFGPLYTFRIQGIVTIIGIVIGASLIKAAPEGFYPPGFNMSEEEKNYSHNYSPIEMIKTWQYWFLLLMYIIANATGLMVVGNAAPIGQAIASITAIQAGIVISVLAIANTLGRFSGGALSDKFGPFKVVIALYIINAITMFSMRFCTNFFSYSFAIALLAFNFGGMVGSYPSIVLNHFGQKFYSINYGLVFMAFGIGGLIGPRIASVTLNATGAYNFAFFIAGGICIIGAIMAFSLKRYYHKEYLKK